MVLLETNNYLLNKYFDAHKFTFGNSRAEIKEQISLNQNTVTGGQDKSGHQ